MCGQPEINLIYIYREAEGRDLSISSLKYGACATSANDKKRQPKARCNLLTRQIDPMLRLCKNATGKKSDKLRWSHAEPLFPRSFGWFQEQHLGSSSVHSDASHDLLNTLLPPRRSSMFSHKSEDSREAAKHSRSSTLSRASTKKREKKGMKKLHNGKRQAALGAVFRFSHRRRLHLISLWFRLFFVWDSSTTLLSRAMGSPPHVPLHGAISPRLCHVEQNIRD